MTEKTMSGRIDTASRIIKATASEVYEAFMNPNSLIAWLAPSGMYGKVDAFEPWVGGNYQVSLTYELDEGITAKTTATTDVSKGIFVEIIPNKKIVLEGSFVSDDERYQLVMKETWYFEELDNDTRVTIIIENVPSAISKHDHELGLASTLENLAQYVE